ncbi:50S ribosomal protein L3 [Candidatus Woesearchaeota archaeon]|nr:50S ribosomal protein L3 [Candidatus Woesearchaeota archaeon]
MPNTRMPRKGSMGVWPRKRANRIYPRIRNWNYSFSDKPSLLGFAGYKAGMTHLMGINNQKTSPTKDEEISMPITVVECPPLKLLSARFYKQNAYGFFVAKDIMFKPSKEVLRTLSLPKKTQDAKELEQINPEDYSEITAVVYTQPRLAGVGKKKPEVFELKLSGSKKDKLDFIKAHVDKEILFEEVFREAQTVDIHGVTKGKGIQGPVKRFGISLKQHKTEKGRREPGSRGAWCAQQHTMYRTAYAGQMGYHQRTQLNAQIIKINSKPEEINPKDGFVHYGKVKTTYVLIKGSVQGAKKRLIILTQPMRPHKKEAPLPTITHISLQSKQGR